MDHWQTLDKELDAWAESGKTADLWWRDDDAITVGPRLDRLITITESTGLLLAVIPARVEPVLAEAVKAAPHVAVAQHGYAHINHAPRGKGMGAWELGLHRGEKAVLDELDCGRQRLEALFNNSFVPVVVPPWNHIDPTLLAPIAARGYCGVSGFGPRDCVKTYPDFAVVNAHCDPIRWKNGAAFKGEAKSIGNLVEHLQARRTGVIDATEPTGYLTHHIDLDEESWAFSEKLLMRINRHPAACWRRDISAVFSGTNA